MPSRPKRRSIKSTRPSLTSIEQQLSQLRSQRWTGSFDIYHSSLAVLEAAVQAGNHLLEAEAILLLGRSFAPMIFPLHALELFRRAEAIFLSNHDLAKAAVCRAMQARAEFDAGRDRDAIASAAQALEASSLPVDHRVAAWLCIALGRMHLGDIGAAIDIVDTRALPLARLEGASDILPHAIRAAAAVRLNHMLAVQTPLLWRGLPLVEADRPRTVTTAEVTSLVQRARLALPEGVHWPILDMTELLAEGLLHDGAAALETLRAYAADNRRKDPPAACWALFCVSLLLTRSHAHQEAIAQLDDAIALGRTYELGLFIGDALMQQARLLEHTGESAKALHAFKAAWDARIVGLRGSREPAGTLADSKVATASADASNALRHVQPVSVRCAVKFIAQHLSAKFTINDIVAFCDVGRRSLENAFKEAHGVTIQQYIRAQRLQRASELLLNTNLSIGDVARSTGFGTASSFARDFVRQQGVTPYRFRQTRP